MPAVKIQPEATLKKINLPNIIFENIHIFWEAGLACGFEMFETKAAAE